ncbi:hypothetical protein ACCO45_002284 [Purpureocillium lilacinum]|uniref:Uncharacterized protein n=1 Tax=Purpureocillium lilacinum TaxID=33203 RepID=A0ACC4E9G2_PURLI
MLTQDRHNVCRAGLLVHPLRYCRWAARERPALFWSVIVGAAGPALMPIVPPIRHYFGDVDPAPVPVTYPVPNGPRKQLTGYDD